MTEERKGEILNKAFDWFAEHFEGEELHDVLAEQLDMDDDEIAESGFDLLEMNPVIDL